MRRVECSVVYRVEGGETTRSFTGRLADLYSRDGAEFVMFEEGESVRLDRALTVDGVDFIGEGAIAWPYAIYIVFFQRPIAD